MGMGMGMQVDEGMVPRSSEPTHERLFREHQSRLERQRRRQEEGEEWKKYTYHPNIGRSQASGPTGVRSSYAYIAESLIEEQNMSRARDMEGDNSMAALGNAIATPRSDIEEQQEALLLIFSDVR